MKIKFKGSISRSTRIENLIYRIKKQESGAKAIEIKLDGKERIVREVYIIK